MDNLIRYCCDKGIHNFVDFKHERKSRIVMKEHFVSNKNVMKYDLAPFVQPDRFGRYKIPKYILRKISNLISDILSGYLCEVRLPMISGVRGSRLKRYTIEEVPSLLLNPNDDIRKKYNEIQEDLDKDLIRNRAIKIWNIKRKLKLNENIIK